MDNYILMIPHCSRLPRRLCAMLTFGRHFYRWKRNPATGFVERRC